MARLSLSGHGGARIGAGDKKRSAKAAPKVDVISTSRPHSVTTASGWDAEAVQGVYDELAPLAREQGTLIPATDAEFRTLCAQVLIQRRLALALLQARSIDAKWRQRECMYDRVTRRLEVKFRSYRLAPMGEPMVALEQKTQTPLELLKGRRRAG